MDPSSILNIFLFFLFVILSAFFSGLKTALFSLNSSTLTAFTQGSKSQKKIYNLIQNKKRLILTLQVGVIMNSAFAVVLSCYFWASLFDADINLNAILGVGVGVSVFVVFRITLAEILSTNLAIKNPKNYTHLSFYPLVIFYYLLIPGTVIFEYISRKVISLLGLVREKTDLSEKELRNIIDFSNEGVALLKDEKAMIQGIFEMTETIAREIMVPRTDLVCVEKGTSLSQLFKINKVKNHSRIPVYDETIDNIIGILHIKDLLPLIKKRSYADFDIMKLATEPYFVPEQKRVNELLRELRTERIHLAVVMDEYGGTSGIVTLEDVIEEIVGEIQDEYDKETPQITVIDDNTFLVSGSILIDDLNEELDLHIPEEEGIDTLAGFLLGQFGSVPKTKSKISWNGYDFIIERVLSRRIERVRIIKKEALADAK